MNFFKSILIFGALFMCAETYAASAGSLKHNEEGIPYETEKFFSPYSAFFKDNSKRARCKKANSKNTEESKQLNLEVKFPEKPVVEDQKPAGKETLGIDYITPVMTNVPSFEN